MKLRIPRYPKDFEKRARKSSGSEITKLINEHIEKIIEFMTKNNTVNHSISFEDVLIIVDKVEAEEEVYYEVSVAKKHRVARVKVD